MRGQKAYHWRTAQRGAAAEHVTFYAVKQDDGFKCSIRSAQAEAQPLIGFCVVCWDANQCVTYPHGTGSIFQFGNVISNSADDH